MKFNIKPNTLNYEEIKQKLSAKFPDYEFNMRGKQYLVCKKTSTAGCNIVIRKNRMFVVGNFPSMGGQMLFMLLVVLLGVLIPLIVYFAAFHSKLKNLENELGAYLKEEYEDKV
ncbi:hypothetical protein K6119_13885 [Paracrocinitomix mangrovi]|uniref:hypothetical protein n=1 Tax=Paracrocinitomix mangrovi TaxID=2862509 RepID=UPI001C8E763E|nr:hypothetical protein [Paracrocinitomix mangrovi]UKN00820.1 hypothetical protein K6119_13885 [Paracrocinitomix mangrovi]